MSYLRTVLWDNRQKVTVVASSVPLLVIAVRKGWVKLKFVTLLVVCLYFARRRLLLLWHQKKITKTVQKKHLPVTSSTAPPIHTFSEASEFSKVFGSNLTDKQKLKLYGLYKQATVGDCTIDRPSK